MRAAQKYRAIALWIGAMVLVAFSAAADSASDLESANTKSETTESPQAAPVDDGAYDPLFDDEWDDEEDPSTNDPFENSNRAILKFNQRFHRMLLDPLARGYRFVVPEPVRQGLRRAALNLNSPSIFVNDILQLRFKDAGQTLGRFILNTSLGVGGIFDVGIEAGWEYHNADFGQTLAWIGVGSGPYLVVPLFGPNTVRDGVGDVVDVLFSPLTYLIGPAQNLIIGTGVGFAEFEARGPAMRALEESSIDYYAALRSAYLQTRAAEIRARFGPSD
jgi:phospholipid-binding lipoprotein MlaA